MNILYVEHIDQVRGLFLAQLQAAGWNAHGATRPDSARSIIAAHGLPRLIIANLPTYSETAADVTKAFIGELGARPGNRISG